MDMSFSHVCVWPSPTWRVAILFCVAWPLVLAGLAVRRRGWLAGATLPMMLPPLFVGLAAAFMEVANVLRGRAISGGGTVAFSAGMAEAFLPIAIGTAIATLLGAFSLLGRSADDAQPRVPIADLTLATAAIILLFLQLAATARATETAALTAAAISALAALAALVRVFTSLRTPVPRNRPLAVAATLVSAAACFAAWQVHGWLYEIAVRGFG